MARVAAALTRKLACTRALSLRNGFAVIAAGHKGWGVRLCERTTPDADIRAGVVVGEKGAVALPVDAAVPHHGKDVVAVREDVWHAHRVTVCVPLFVGTTIGVLSTVIAALSPAAPLEGSFLVPIGVVHVLDRHERAAVKPSFMIVAVPFNIDPTAHVPTCGTGSVACSWPPQAQTTRSAGTDQNRLDGCSR